MEVFERTVNVFIGGKRLNFKKQQHTQIVQLSFLYLAS